MTQERSFGFLNEGLPQIVKNVEKLNPSDLPQWARELAELQYLPDQIIIAEPLSYCAGVVRANRVADELLEKSKGQVYLYHAPIHNETKLAQWEERGAIVVNSLDDIADGSVVLFSAHGVSPEIWSAAKAKRLRGADATCPLVYKTHKEVRELVDQGYKILLIGHRNHDEVVGTIGEAPETIIVIHPKIAKEDVDSILEGLKEEKLALRSQTTLAVGDLEELVEYIRSKRSDLNLPAKSDVCYATHNRQEAVIQTIVGSGAQLMLIFGSDETKRSPSSNSIRLREVVQSLGVPAFLVEDVSEIKSEWFRGSSRIGVSAGASAAPERVAEFLACMSAIGLKNSQIARVTVAEEPQVFAPAKRFDFS